MGNPSKVKHIGVTAALSRRDHAEAPGTMPLQDTVFREGKTETKSLLPQQVQKNRAFDFKGSGGNQIIRTR